MPKSHLELHQNLRLNSCTIHKHLINNAVYKAYHNMMSHTSYMYDPTNPRSLCAALHKSTYLQHLALARQWSSKLILTSPLLLTMQFVLHCKT